MAALVAAIHAVVFGTDRGKGGPGAAAWMPGTVPGHDDAGEGYANPSAFSVRCTAGRACMRA
jgi:hypothetical protein